jgi:hypothetical protein
LIDDQDSPKRLLVHRSPAHAQDYQEIHIVRTLEQPVLECVQHLPHDCVLILNQFRLKRHRNVGLRKQQPHLTIRIAAQRKRPVAPVPQSGHDR